MVDASANAYLELENVKLDLFYLGLQLFAISVQLEILHLRAWRVMWQARSSADYFMQGVNMIGTYAATFIVEIGDQELPKDISAHIKRFTYEENEKQMDELSITIKEINYSFGEDGLIRMEITVYDKYYKLTSRAYRQSWKDIAAKHNFSAVVEVEDDLLYEFLSEGAKNDLVFLKELAEDAGCSVWVVNDELHFKPLR